MIVIWGSPKTREYGGMKLTIYLFIGSMLALIGALAIYSSSGLGTFNLLELEQAVFPETFQRIWFPVVFSWFAIFGRYFSPFHSWARMAMWQPQQRFPCSCRGRNEGGSIVAALRVAIRCCLMERISGHRLLLIWQPSM